MIARIEWLFMELRRRLSRSEWLIRIRGLSKSVGTEAQPGLVLVQIDGLSRPEFERAIANGRMPFLNSLLGKEDYRLSSVFSGLPSNTFGFQGELLYGVPQSIPAFGFRDRGTGREMVMYDPRAASAAQKRTEALGSGLLQGGSSYSNAYSGGAAESHFCPATLPIGENEKAGTFFKKLIFLVLHAGSLIPVAALMVLEAGLAVLDFIRGLIAGQDLAKELKFVPTRVAICILLRELITIGARIDIARGLPVIHLNYLGYDEQAHRRGPSSAFAHWTLKGIDGAIKKLWYSARRSSRRDYAVWVFSDHGQEETVPYEEETGRTIDEAVAWVFGRSVRKAPAGRFGSKGIQLQRAGWLGGRIAAWVFGSHVIKPAPLVTAVGPLGFIYPASPLSEEDRIRIARDLVRAAGIPLVMIPDGKDRARVWTPRGEFLFPVDAKEVLGEDHPFLEAAARDMTALASHPDAGSFVISGWRPGRQSVSFPNENGAHAGPGSLETLAFLMVPPGTPLEMQRGKPLRAMDIRKAVQQTLHHPRVSLKKLYRGGPRRRTGIRIMTYNVHSCIGMDRRVAPDRIARVIAEFDPDVVALQELDVGRHRTQKTDQAHILAEQLQMAHHFHPAIHVEEEKYGDAVLSRLPMRLIKAASLPGLPGRPFLEPRGALWVGIKLGTRELNLMNTHLGLYRRERLMQAEALLGPAWLGNPECREPVVLCGDFNALPGSPAFRRFTGRLQDAQMTLENHRPRGTWFGRLPLHRIDHVFMDRSVQVTGITVPRTALTRVASDHLPLIVDLEF